VEEIDEAVLPSMTPPEPSRWNMRIAGGVILAGVLVIGGWQIWRAFAPPAGTPMDAELKTDQSAPTPTTPAVTTPAASMAPASATSTPATTPAAGPAVKPAARNSTPSPMPDEVVTRMVNPGATKTAEPVSAPPPSEAAKIEEAPPPVIGFISRPVAESPTISNMLHTPVAAPSLDNPPAVSKISGGKLVQRVEPVYPRSAPGMYGEVTLTAMIGIDGKVKSIKVVNGHGLLAQAAVAAVRRWRYQPFVLNGVPIEVENTIVVRFKGPSQN
jgi:protein TonB